MTRRVLIMAGGTGGHVFPALAVAEKLRQKDVEVTWIGTEHGIESKLVPASGYHLNNIPVQGLRGNGVMRWLNAPFKLAGAMIKVMKIIKQFQPDVVLGLGGFVSGPGGVAAKLSGKPLIIHEQNAVPGLTNRLLAKIADKVLAGFPNSFTQSARVKWVGNPVRESIENLLEPGLRMQGRRGDIHILILGGSLGAKTLNTLLPQVLVDIEDVQIRHQCGNQHLEACRSNYRHAGVDAEVTAFIEDMAQAYEWADLVICRAGALTIAELAAAGVASILIPYPYAVDDHQTKNAALLAEVGAARILQEKDLTEASLKKEISRLVTDRNKLIMMAEKARMKAKKRVAQSIASLCVEMANG